MPTIARPGSAARPAGSRPGADSALGRSAAAARGVAAPGAASEPLAARREPWAYLALGLATAPLFAWVPLFRTMAWFLAALVHEMGHAALAWLCGMPSLPAISLAGHAAAVHGPPLPLLALAITGALAALAWTRLAGGARAVGLALALVVQPALAFTPLRELAHLLAGHGAEIAFAALCLWRALDGGFTRSRLERALYGALGWMLLGRNASLCLGLMRSAAARAEYRSNGSFGLTNDYLRAASFLGWTLPSVALVMLLATLLALPAALGLWRLSRAARA